MTSTSTSTNTNTTLKTHSVCFHSQAASSPTANGSEPPSLQRSRSGRSYEALGSSIANRMLLVLLMRILLLDTLSYFIRRQPPRQQRTAASFPPFNAPGMAGTTKPSVPQLWLRAHGPRCALARPGRRQAMDGLLLPRSRKVTSRSTTPCWGKNICVYVYVCVYIYIYIYIYIYVYVCVRVCVCVHIYIYMCVCVSVCVYEAMDSLLLPRRGTVTSWSVTACRGNATALHIYIYMYIYYIDIDR